jgi:hypothetical protein
LTTLSDFVDLTNDFRLLWTSTNGSIKIYGLIGKSIDQPHYFIWLQTIMGKGVESKLLLLAPEAIAACVRSGGLAVLVKTQ